ncbi:MAG: hypothetical protein IH897_15575 [Planctomycetes bacterium]|nr:hypothetical protein [Planctomycetota bacterium]
MTAAPCTLLLLMATWSPPVQQAICTCDAAKMKGGWCERCNVGHIASVRIESADLFEWLDAHGHHIDPDRIECELCQEAIATDGFCERCRMGYVGKEAFLSRLTYHVAKGRPRSLAKIQCSTCRKNAGRFGWCDRCKVGMVGNVAIRDREDYGRAVDAFRILLAAVRAARKCESCALAIVSNTTCRACKITYSNGNPIPPN